MTIIINPDQPHYFDSARDAIDALSAFEASTTGNWSYWVNTQLEGLCAVKVLPAGAHHIVEGWLQPEEA
jgi:hypothetical protein